MKVESRVTTIASAPVGGGFIAHLRWQRRGDLERVTAKGLRIRAGVHREHLPQHLGSRPIGHQGGELRPQPIQLRGRADMRRPPQACLGHAASNTAVAGQPDGDLAEQRGDRVLTIILDPAGRATAAALRTVHGLDPGLRGDKLLLDASQELLALGQAQTQAGQIGKGVGLAIRMTSVLCSSPSAPMLTSLTIQATLPLPQREYRPENTSSGLAPPISRRSHSIGSEVLLDVRSGRLRVADACELLRPEAAAGLSVAGRFEARGRSQPGFETARSAEQTIVCPKHIVSWRCRWFARRYADFGPTLGGGEAGKVHGCTISRETLRVWMIAGSVGRSPPSAAPPRISRAAGARLLGRAVYFDGSEHAWFEDRRREVTLLAFVDERDKPIDASAVCRVGIDIRLFPRDAQLS